MTNVGPYIRAAILANSSIASELSTWQGSPAVFTRSPVPDDAEYPMVVTPADVAVTDQDAIRNLRTVVVRDIFVYGNLGAPGSTEDHTRIVEDAAYEIRRMFHRKSSSLGNTPFHVIDIKASGPQIAPTEMYASSEPNIIGRVVTLTLRIEENDS